MHRSLSREGLSVYEGFGGMQDSGIDLSEFQSQLAQDRCSRTMTFQKITRPSIARFCERSISKLEKEQYNESSPFLDIDNACSILEKLNSDEMTTFLKNITICAEKNPKAMEPFLQSTEIPKQLSNALMSSTSDPIKILLLNTIAVLFPISEQVQNVYIDEGICFTISEFLQSDSDDLILASIGIIGVFSQSSSYARDAVMCIDLHITLMEIANTSKSTEIINASCESLSHMFENSEPIDAAILLRCVEPMTPLLNLESEDALQSVLVCFVDMTNQMSSIIFSIFENNLYQRIIELLPNPALTSTVLRLIGNMSIAQPSQISAMLKIGLFPSLIELLTTEFTADVYWVLSSFLMSVPQMMITLFTPEFIDNTIEIAMYSSIGVKKEASYFLATVIFFADDNLLNVLMKKDLISVLIEMLNSDIVLITLRIIDSLIRFINVLTKDPKINREFIQQLLDEDTKKILKKLEIGDQDLVVERVKFLETQIDLLK
ncbi:hypothetical protein GPJ56_004306 [Histomonas meleagridis]|uniref:uncharacterized protein n=1 Tax=Histomonas meleagridis TaxID=135588 RepID=UPI003559E4EC|nr:hypothetical protein GPJ56_004306 [Histomonas meleagridis]KAH0800479.1 hypothetical protein GO595_006682 [Histomonas meleagridis]